MVGTARDEWTIEDAADYVANGPYQPSCSRDETPGDVYSIAGLTPEHSQLVAEVVWEQRREFERDGARRFAGFVAHNVETEHLKEVIGKLPAHVDGLLAIWAEAVRAELWRRGERTDGDTSAEQDDTPLHVFTASDLLKLELPEPRHIVAGVLAEGSAILAGRPKMGKSWLSLQLGIAVASGNPLFSTHDVDQGDVAYLALEDNPRRLKSRLSLALGTDKPPASLSLYTEWPRLDIGGAEQLERWCVNAPQPRLVIVDTLAKVKPRKPRNVDPYEHDHAVMSEFTRIAGQYGITIVLVHHTRKAASDDFIDSVTGTLGLSGGTDATLVLTRERGQADATLSITGRDVDEQELALQFDDNSCHWRVLGDAETYRQSKARIEIVELMTKERRAMPPVEVARMLRKKHSTTRWLMAQMAQTGTLRSWHDGKYTVKRQDDQHHQHHQPD